LLLIYPPVLEGYSTIFPGAIAHHFQFSCPFFCVDGRMHTFRCHFSVAPPVIMGYIERHQFSFPIRPQWEHATVATIQFLQAPPTKVAMLILLGKSILCFPYSYIHVC
jgi:hypothetical protein